MNKPVKINEVEKTILTLSNQSGGRKAFIWEVKEVLVGNKITIDGEEII